jgi:tetratricopeptide (TPR) repeat protein
LTSNGPALEGKVVTSMLQGVELKNLSFNGNELKFTATLAGNPIAFSGKLVGDTIEGIAGEGNQASTWIAKRTEKAQLDSPKLPADFQAFTQASGNRDPAERIKALEKFVQDNPTSRLISPAYFSMYTAALQIAPDDKGRIMGYANKSLEASSQEEKAEAHNRIAWDLVERGLYLDEAEEISKKSIELLNDKVSSEERGNIKDTLGWIYFKKKSYSEAEKLLTEAVNLNPNSGELLGHLGQVYQAMGQPDRAFDIYMRAAVIGIDKATRTALETLYKEKHGSLAGLHEALDRELTKKPAPFDPGDYEPAKDRTSRVVLVEAFSGAG